MSAHVDCALGDRPHAGHYLSAANPTNGLGLWCDGTPTPAPARDTDEEGGA